MTSVTYQTLVPSELTEFCEAMAQLFSQVERDLYLALSRGENLNQLKRSYQIKFGINARQFNSIRASIKGKISSRLQSHQRQLSELKSRISALEKSRKAKAKKLKKTYPSCGLGRNRSLKGQLRFSLHQKHRQLVRFKDKLARLKREKPSLIFGGYQLWKAQFNLEENGYKSHEQWRDDWRQRRNSQFMLVGSKDETAGCQNCQLSDEGNLKIRVPYVLTSEFGDYVNARGIKFSYGQQDIDYALSKGQALTFRMARKRGKWYLFVTTDRPEVPYQSKKGNGMLGIDLNPNVVGWAYCDGEGNLKAKGQIRFNLRDRKSNQIKATLGDLAKQLVDIASHKRCPIVLERLDFTKKKASLKERGVKYSRMLSNFSYSSFRQLLESRCQRRGIQLILVNPAYSSLIGLTKFMKQYGLSSDTAAALVLARRGAFKSERIPASYARQVRVDPCRHVWSFWNALSKKQRGVSRHSFFSRDASQHSRGHPLG